MFLLFFTMRCIFFYWFAFKKSAKYFFCYWGSHSLGTVDLKFKNYKCVISYIWSDLNLPFVVYECGDDISNISHDETLLVVNHQSPTDIGTMMRVLQVWTFCMLYCCKYLSISIFNKQTLNIVVLVCNSAFLICIKIADPCLF